MERPKLEGVDVLKVSMEHLFPPDINSVNNETIQAGYTFSAALQDPEKQMFGFYVGAKITSAFSLIDLELGARYTKIAKAWEDLTEKEQSTFISAVLLPDVYPYIRSLVQMTSGVLGTPPTIMNMLEDTNLEPHLHTTVSESQSSL